MVKREGSSPSERINFNHGGRIRKDVEAYLLNIFLKDVYAEVMATGRYHPPTILKPKRIFIKCVDCKKTFIGFYSEAKRLGWWDVPGGNICFRCKHNKTYSCHKCGRSVKFNTLDASPLFVAVQFGFKFIPLGTGIVLCKYCYPGYKLPVTENMFSGLGELMKASKIIPVTSRFNKDEEYCIELEDQNDVSERKKELKIRWFEKTKGNYTRIANSIMRA